GNFARSDAARDLIGGDRTDRVDAWNPDQILADAQTRAWGRRRRLARGAHLFDRGDDCRNIEQVGPEGVRLVADTRVARDLAGANAARELIGGHGSDGITTIDADVPNLRLVRLPMHVERRCFVHRRGGRHRGDGAWSLNAPRASNFSPFQRASRNAIFSS